MSINSTKDLLFAQKYQKNQQNYFKNVIFDNENKHKILNISRNVFDVKQLMQRFSTWMLWHTNMSHMISCAQQKFSFKFYCDFAKYQKFNFFIFIFLVYFSCETKSSKNIIKKISHLHVKLMFLEISRNLCKEKITITT